MSDSAPPATDQRAADREEVSWLVDCDSEDTFLYASITNISVMGIFVRTSEPLEVGTCLTLGFEPRSGERFVMRGRVQWVNPIIAFGDNPNPGMGIVFIDLEPDQRERLVATIRSIAYLRDVLTN